MKHQLTRKRIVSILLAVCMLVSMLPLAGAMDVSEGSAYAEINGGNAYYRYFIPGQYTHQWYNNSGVPGQAADYHWTVYQNLWNGTAGHSTNKSGKLDGITNGGVSTHYGTDQKTDAFYLHQYDLEGNQILFGSYYGVATNKSLQMTIRVPSSDTYTLKGNMYYGLGAQDDAVDYWIAPDDAADPMAEEYYVGQLTGISNGGVLDVVKFGEVGEVDLEAGEYIVTQKGANGKALYGGSIELWGSMAPTIIDLSVDDSALNDEGYLEVPAGDEDGVWLNISAYDPVFEMDLDLIEMDAPTYTRVDEYSDMITASYEDGMVNVKASHIGDTDTAVATLYMEVMGAATWIEIPVKVVAGSESIITLSHTGATDKIMAKIGAYPITLKANIDGSDTAITDEDVVEVEIVDADGNVTDAVTATVDGANISFKATAAGSYTARVTATVAGVSTKAAYEIPLTVSAFSLNYNFMKLTGVADGGSSGFWMQDFIDSYADTWTGGSTDVNTAAASDGWKIGAKGEGAGEWLWTSSASIYGAYFAPAGSWNSIDLYVPVSGNYDVTSVYSAWSSSANVDFYIAPVGTADPIQDQYKLTSVDYTVGENLAETSAAIGNVDLEAGEYMIAFKSANGIFQKAIKMELTGEAGDTKVWIDDATIVAEYSDISRTYWTWNVKALPAFLADNVKFTFSSSNTKVFQVNPNTSITINHEGYADIIITGSDGSVCRVPAIAGTPDVSYKFRTGAISAYTAKGGNAYLMDTAFYLQGYSHAEDNGYGPWFVSGGASCDAGHPAYMFCNWGATSTNGLLATYGNTITDFGQFQIRVDEAGEYLIKTLVDKNYVGWAPHNIYLAPAGVENPTADEYLIGEVRGTRATSGKAFTPFVMEPVELEAGEYTITFTKINVAGSTVATSLNGYDYITVNDFNFYKLDKVSVALDTVDGAQIRTTGKQGLRFISSIQKSGDIALVKEVGTVLIPTADLADDADLVIGYSANGHDALKVPAVKYYSEDDNKIEFTAVITDIAAANYGRAISARAYAIVEDVYGNEYTIYGDAVTSRSVLQVAQNGLLDPDASEEDKAVFQGIVDAANA